MGSKTIAVDEEAYEVLRSQKRPGETFSEVVKRLGPRKRPLTDFIGIWKDMPEADLRRIENYVRRGRQLDRRRMRRWLK